MSLTLRNVKGSPLTYTEMDNNLTYLEGLGAGASSSIAGLSFSAVLGVGNETNGNNIVLSDGDVIGNSNGDLEFVDIPYGGVVSTDAPGPGLGTFVSYSISPNSTDGSGTGLFVMINRDTRTNDINISDILNPGQDYEVGDTITFLGTQFGLTSPADDATYTITAVDQGFQGLRINADTILAGTLNTNGNDIKLSDGKIFNDDAVDLISGLELAVGGISLSSENTDSGDISSVSVSPSNVNIQTQNAVKDVGGMNLNPGVVTVEALNGDFISGLELDPAENLLNPGTKLFTEDTDSGDFSVLEVKSNNVKIETTTTSGDVSILNSEPGVSRYTVVNGILQSGLEFDPAENLPNPGTKLYTIDKYTMDKSEIKLTPTEITIDTINLFLETIPTYADNAAAITGGATANQVYKTSTGELRIVV